jgi:S-adenosylmethionine:tRNA ribosyltransferase-isomerase
MNVADFDYELPDELIAQEAAPRGASRLMVLDRTSGEIRDAMVRELPRFLRAGDLLVANDTRVFPARLLGHRVPSGGAVECLLLQREPELERAGHPVQVWSALVHPGQKLKPGSLASFEGSGGVLMAEILERQFFGRRRIKLWTESGGDVDTLVDALGHVPLPPYIHRGDTPADRERYQTLFAEHRGSIAAPTAGLHFDEAMLAALAESGVERTTITLHVGYGTFKPVRSDTVEAHVVDAEPYEISAEAADRIAAARGAGRRVVAVGTTTTRALEDAARKGDGRVRAGRARADLFIYPGFGFRVISGLMTNFHLPKSSLLMLVSSFASRPSTAAGRELVEGRERVLAAYRHAVEQRYRFYSYGDAMLVV